MLLGIDHLVVACRNPDAAVDLITAEIGLLAGGGGRHARLGTFNRLIWLGDSYLELMGVEDADVARGRGIGAAAVALLDRDEEGLASFAIATDDIVADVATLRATGATFDDPTPGERDRPDGTTVRWHTALPNRFGADGLPFLIEHDYTGAEWGDAERTARAEVVHPFGGRAVLARLEIAVDDPGAAAARLHDGAGLAVIRESDGSADLPVGPQLIRYVRRSAGVPAATVVIAGTDGGPRSVDLLGCRFLVEVATLGPETR